MSKQEGITVFVNGKKLAFPVAPILHKWSTPLIGNFSEALGANVTWNDKTQVIQITTS